MVRYMPVNGRGLARFLGARTVRIGSPDDGCSARGCTVHARVQGVGVEAHMNIKSAMKLAGILRANGYTPRVTETGVFWSR